MNLLDYYLNQIKFGLSSPIPAKFFKAHTFEVFPQSSKLEKVLPFAVRFRHEIITAFKAQSPSILKVLGDDSSPFLETQFKSKPVRRLPDHKDDSDDEKNETPAKKEDQNNNSQEVVYISSDDAPAKYISDEEDRSGDDFRLDCPTTSSEDEIVAPKNGTRLALASSDEDL